MEAPADETRDAPHIWQLRRGADKRFRAGHPWVYSNELAHSPRGAAQGAAVLPGDPVELRDAGGAFLARGYGNPATLIAFRALSRDPAEAQPWSEAGLRARLERAAALRRALGLGALSHRLVHGEADGLPGLVLDRYRLAASAAGATDATDESPRQALVLQEHSAGAERLHAPLLAALEALVEGEHAADPAAPDWARSAVVLRNDVGARRLEGLPDDAPQVLRAPPGSDLSAATILVAAPWEAAPRDADGADAATQAAGGAATAFRVDLAGGQKTGFYLDQAANVRLAAGLLAPLLRTGALGAPGEPLRVLDLFAYVGQWGTQFARVARGAGRSAHVTALDASAPALALAGANVAAAGATCEAVRADALEQLDALPARAFDVVVADPPAFIKGRKAWHTGRAAYVKLHTAALRRLRPGGLYVACSCSQLLDEAEFAAVLHKAAGRAEVSLRWLARGGQAPDHPVLAGFPEGDYLKCRVGLLD
jgi:23S rRNA (cytosine1962-C5)-methyltransferase